MNGRRNGFLSPYFLAIVAIAIIFMLAKWLSVADESPISMNQKQMLEQDEHLNIAANNPPNHEEATPDIRPRVKKTITKKAKTKTAEETPEKEQKQKKKKKKKKKKSKKSGTDLDPTNSSDDGDDDSGLSDDESDQSASIGNGFNNAPNEVTNRPKTIDEWRRFLFNSPSLSKTTQFIEAYLSNQVSADIFFTLSYEMIENSSDTLSEQGVIALGATPSEDSFIGLAYFEDKEKGEVKKLINQYLETYTQLTQLKFLGKALRSDEPKAQLHAALLIAKSATAHLQVSHNDRATNGDPQPRTSRGIDDSSTGRGRAGSQLSVIKQRYSQLYAQLDQLRQQSSVDEVRQAANQAANLLQSLLNVRPAETTTAANFEDDSFS